ncbi:MAG: 1-(5-phosphoribosyl)-5-((5-phosphoribosylamino)methylideneamino)imidazole-4-carboxamide isomerase, partial [Chloroflexi bacterium]|nr:1-(5-phosphoribosyl)-5-((5-phosphoribosylamino)methylideneamino)imidazole-4-carboxamide isomerase [Chloroflexota bacterium]
MGGCPPSSLSLPPSLDRRRGQGDKVVHIIPAIDIRGGKCVRLAQGDYARETIFSADPVAMAQQWVRQGATRLHVVDLDGAATGRPHNLTLIERIAREAGCAVQVGGGIRDLATVERLLALGADR